MALFETKAAEKELTLFSSIDPRLSGCVQSDPTRLRQILINLLSNAIKFTEQGEVRVRAKLLKETGNQLRVRFEVEDSGIGIVPTDLTRLLQPFTQADSSITRRYGGTGLGLSICVRLVELLSGTIGAEMGTDKGSLFWFEINLLRSQSLQAVPEPVFQSYSPGSALPDPIDTKYSILLVEDNPFNQSIVIMQLRKLNYNVAVAENGLEAIATLSQQPYDLVLMDCQMPIMDGLEATRRIRGLTTKMQSIPILALTANVTSEYRELCLKAGMNDYLSKPLLLEPLQQALLKWLPTKAANTALSTQLYSKVIKPKGNNTGQPMDDYGVLDAAIIDSLKNLSSQNGKNLLPELLNLFLTESPGWVDNISHAVEQKDAQALVYAAHFLKGASQNLGAAKFSQLCLALEKFGRAEAISQAELFLPQLKEGYAQLRQSLQNLILTNI